MATRLPSASSRPTLARNDGEAEPVTTTPQGFQAAEFHQRLQLLGATLASRNQAS